MKVMAFLVARTTFQKPDIALVNVMSFLVARNTFHKPDKVCLPIKRLTRPVPSQTESPSSQIITLMNVMAFLVARTTCTMTKTVMMMNNRG